MNERLGIQDLINLFAEKHSMDKKDVDWFIKEFFLLIEQGLEDDRCVKIKGLGTFKLVDVDSRESIKVNTGERFQIQEHTKVSFTPDAALRDVINKPFAHFETVVLNENTVLEDTLVDSLEEDTEEPTNSSIVEVIIERVEEHEGTITQPSSNVIIGVEENMEGIPESSEMTIEDTRMKQPTVDTENGVITEECSTIIEQLQPIECGSMVDKIIAQEVKNTTHFYPAETPTKRQEYPPKVVQHTSKEKKSPVAFLVVAIIAVLLLCGSAVLYIYHPDILSIFDKKEIVKEEVFHPVVREETLVVDTIKRDSVVEVAPGIEQEVLAKPSRKALEPAKVDSKADLTYKVVGEKEPKLVAKTGTPVNSDSVNYEIKGTKATYTIKNGETLTRVSLQFYGIKNLWPYIVKHNKDVIKNPDNVPYGTVLKIPELVKKQ